MLSQQTDSRIAWTPWIFAIAGFWLSSNIVLDFLVMPVMYVTGMTTQASFATAGYSLFWSFNRIELMCAAMILTGVLALRRRPTEFEVAHSGSRCRWALMFSVGLLSLAFIDTYVLAPEMSAMALPLETLRSAAIVPAMNWMHAAYWLLDILKVSCLAGLAGLCFGDLRDRATASVDILA
jgi:hypothetical protein